MKKPKILLYSHDTFGLGHLRRSLSIAHQIAKDIPEARQLLLTGSMVAGAFSLPQHLDLIKLPALSKRSSGQYKARVLPLSLKQTLSWRQEMILQAVDHFQPDLLLVDKVAGGVRGELMPALRHLKTWQPHCKIVLGMRDIEDDPIITQAEWHTNGVPDLLDNVYDTILYYGQRDVFDPVANYAMSEISAGKLIECGYLRRAEQTRPTTDVRRELNIGDKPFIVITAGGGGDGYPMLRATLDMLNHHHLPCHFLLVTGPLMPQPKRQILQKIAGKLGVTYFEFTPDLPSYLSAADLVISMAGYNTVSEILSLQKRALLIPRVTIRAEQKIRATNLAQRGLAHCLLPHDLTPDTFANAINTALATPPPIVNLNLDGLPNITHTIADLLSTARPKRNIKQYDV
jgi:predicted glycosyltransferase